MVATFGQRTTLLSSETRGVLVLPPCVRPKNFYCSSGLFIIIYYHYGLLYLLYSYCCLYCHRTTAVNSDNIFFTWTISVGWFCLKLSKKRWVQSAHSILEYNGSSLWMAIMLSRRPPYHICALSTLLVIADGRTFAT